MAKLPKTLITAAAAALMAVPLAAGTASAQSDSFLVQGASATTDLARTRIRNGVEVLRPTDEEHTNEMASFSFDKASFDGQRLQGLVVMMSTGQLDSPAGPNTGDQVQVGNIQGACFPISLVADPTSNTGLAVQTDVANFKYISQRNSDENRAYHHPDVMAMDSAPGYYIVTQNWDRNDNTNTERYIQIVDSQCNLMQIQGSGITVRENGTSAVIMAKDNDNCSGHQSGAYADTMVVNGMEYVAAYELCNGNGRDDGWINHFQVQMDPATATATVNKIFDTSVIAQEERSRGACALSPDGSLATCCGTNGNSQPQREGVYCAGIDMATGDRLWRERVAYRGETSEGQRTYAMRIKMLPETTFDGTRTGNLFLQYQMHRGNNNNNQKGGYDDKVMALTASPTTAGLNPSAHQDITQLVIDSGVEFTHATAFYSWTGQVGGEINPTISYLSPNHNANDIKTKVMNVSYVNGQFTNNTVFTLSGPSDGQKYSKYLGNNPNDQGRGYLDCETIDNPFAGPEDSTKVTACAMTGKLTSAGNPAVKPDLYIELFTQIGPATPPDETNDPDEPNEPNDPSDPNDPNDPNGGTTSGGCSASGGQAGGSAVLLLLAFAFIGIRRRN